MGLPLTTTPEAAAAFNRGLDAVMRVQSGAAEAFTEAVALDPGFALGARRPGDARPRGRRRRRRRTPVAGRRARRGPPSTAPTASAASSPSSTRGSGTAAAAAPTALVRHVHAHPRDVLAVSAAVPTIAFSGVTDVQQEAWDLVEGTRAGVRRSLVVPLAARLRPAGPGALRRGRRAGRGRCWPLEPAAGHAVHARTHVFYETGAHVAGLRWLDPWITTCGRQATHRAHFSWHAALHELSTGDVEAVRRRYAEPARAAGRHRRARAGRLGVAAVALRGDRLVARRRCRSTTCSTHAGRRPGRAAGDAVHRDALGGRADRGR